MLATKRGRSDADDEKAHAPKVLKLEPALGGDSANFEQDAITVVYDRESKPSLRKSTSQFGNPGSEMCTDSSEEEGGQLPEVQKQGAFSERISVKKQNDESCDTPNLGDDKQQSRLGRVSKTFKHRDPRLGPTGMDVAQLDVDNMLLAAKEGLIGDLYFVLLFEPLHKSLKDEGSSIMRSWSRQCCVPPNRVQSLYSWCLHCPMWLRTDERTALLKVGRDLDWVSFVGTGNTGKQTVKDRLIQVLSKQTSLAWQAANMEQRSAFVNIVLGSETAESMKPSDIPSAARQYFDAVTWVRFEDDASLNKMSNVASWAQDILHGTERIYYCTLQGMSQAAAARLLIPGLQPFHPILTILCHIFGTPSQFERVIEKAALEPSIKTACKDSLAANKTFSFESNDEFFRLISRAAVEKESVKTALDAMCSHLIAVAWPKASQKQRVGLVRIIKQWERSIGHLSSAKLRRFAVMDQFPDNSWLDPPFESSEDGNPAIDKHTYCILWAVDILSALLQPTLTGDISTTGARNQSSNRCRKDPMKQTQVPNHMLVQMVLSRASEGTTPEVLIQNIINMVPQSSCLMPQEGPSAKELCQGARPSAGQCALFSWWLQSKYPHEMLHFAQILRISRFQKLSSIPLDSVLEKLQISHSQWQNWVVGRNLPKAHHAGLQEVVQSLTNLNILTPVPICPREIRTGSPCDLNSGKPTHEIIDVDEDVEMKKKYGLTDTSSCLKINGRIPYYRKNPHETESLGYSDLEEDVKAWKNVDSSSPLPEIVRLRRQALYVLGARVSWYEENGNGELSTQQDNSWAGTSTWRYAPSDSAGRSHAATCLDGQKDDIPKILWSRRLRQLSRHRVPFLHSTFKHRREYMIDKDGTLKVINDKGMDSMLSWLSRNRSKKARLREDGQRAAASCGVFGSIPARNRNKQSGANAIHASNSEEIDDRNAST